MAIQPFPHPRKKKIVVLISNGGGGHIMAAEALKEILGEEYEVDVHNVIAKVVKPLDPLHCLTKGKFTGEDLYNFCLKRHQSRMIHFIAMFGAKCMKGPKIEKSFEKFLSKSSLPDLIISVTPFVNFGLAPVAQRHDIPFLIIPTDLDGSSFLLGFPEKKIMGNFKIALAYDDPDVRSMTFEKTPVAEEHVTITGFPVRPACHKKYTPSELTHIRIKFGLLENYSTITLMMGAVGGNLIFEHACSLATFDPRPHSLSLQINICTGHNHEVRSKILNHLFDLGAIPLGHHTYRLPSGLIFHLHGFTTEIIELMAASDLIITKTGSCTVNEAIYLGKKLLLDNTPKATARHLWWEQFNIPFTLKHNLGHSFSDARQLHMLIPSILKYPEQKKQEFVLPNFEENIQKVVRELIS